jgi:hypothetical protein
MKKQFLFLILFLTGYIRGVAQEVEAGGDKTWRFGAYGNFILNRYIVDVAPFLNPNSSANAPFNGGEGTGLEAGFLVEKFLTSEIVLSLRTGYETFSGTLIRYFYISESDVSQRMIKQTLQTKVSDIGFEPTVGIHFSDGGVLFGLYGGMRIASIFHHITNVRYSSVSTEEIPTEIGTRPSESTVNEFATNWQYILRVGFGVEVPLTNDVLVMPEVSYAYGLTDLWNTPGITSCMVRQWRFGCALKYAY